MIIDILLKKLPPAGNTVTLLEFQGTSLHLESDEAKVQIEELGDVGNV